MSPFDARLSSRPSGPIADELSMILRLSSYGSSVICFCRTCLSSREGEIPVGGGLSPFPSRLDAHPRLAIDRIVFKLCCWKKIPSKPEPEAGEREGKKRRIGVEDANPHRPSTIPRLVYRHVVPTQNLHSFPPEVMYSQFPCLFEFEI